MPTMTTRHRQLNLIIQRVPIVPGNPFDPFNSGPTEGAPVQVWARRQDSPVRSELEAGTGQLIALNEYLHRAADNRGVGHRRHHH